MTKSLFRALVLLTGAALLAATALPAAAATLTYNDPNCAGFQITGSGGSFTLSCAKLSCSISGFTTPTTAQDTTLTATCTPAGAGYTWSLVTGPFSHPTCSGPSSPTAATTAIVKPAGIAAGQSRSCLYQVTATAPGLSGQAMATVTWSDGAPVPPVCAPAALTIPTPITSAGGTIQLDAGCVPSTGVTYTWTRTAPIVGQPINPTSATPTDSLGPAGVSPVQYTWNVHACATPSTTACVDKSISVTVPGTGGGGGGGVSCAGFSKTLNINLGWPGFTTLHTQDYGGFNGNDAMVIRIAPPAGALSIAGTAGSINLAEYAGPTTTRYAVLSTNSCDFTGTPGYLTNNTIPILFSGSTTVALNAIQVNMQQYSSVINLLPGNVYYLNIKNTAPDGVTSTCSGGCDMVIQWVKPPGT